MILSSGDADMYDGAMFSFEGDFLGYLGLENMGSMYFISMRYKFSLLCSIIILAQNVVCNSFFRVKLEAAP